MIKRKIQRGDICYIYKYADQIGSEQFSGRPGIIISNDLCNKHSDVVEIVYCTTQPKNDLPTHTRILSTNKESIALCEQIVSVDKSRIGAYMCSCSEKEIEEINAALLISIGMEDYQARPAPKAVNGADIASEKIMEMKVERDTYKKMYDDLLKKVIGR